jgi:hypothetical protein
VTGDASEAGLVALDRDLWVVRRPLPLWIGDVGARMTVVRLAGGGLWLHSPVAIDDALARELDALGAVRWIVAPNKVHFLFAAACAARHPAAALCGAPGLPEKRRELRFDHVLDKPGDAPWGREIPWLLFEGAPRINELVFLHPTSHTLVLTDLAFHLPAGARDGARLFHRLVGATGRFGPHRLVRSLIRDRERARASLRAMLAWDFDRVVVSHGEVLESGGRAALERAFAFLGT